MKKITVTEIFESNQILTVAKAKELKGKKIATTNSEYHANKPCVNIFTVGEIISAWDDAATREYPGEKFKTYQEYWASYMTDVQIEKMKTKLMLFSIEGHSWHSAHTKYDNFYPEPTFTGSDADREVYYVVIDSYQYIIKHSTKGYYQEGHWIYRSENSNWASRFNSLEEAIDVSKKLTVMGSDQLLNMLSIIALVKNEHGLSYRLFARVFPKENRVEYFGEDGKAQLI